MRILVDTNILVRIASPNDPQCDRAFDALALLAEQGHETCITPQVAYEYWVVATRPVDRNGPGLSIEQVLGDLKKFDADLSLLPDSAEIFSIWRTLVEKHKVLGKPAHDARLVAAMLRHGVTHLLTFNAPDFARYTEITAISPEASATFPPAA